MVRSWTVPFSMILATVVAQSIYIDLSTILVDTLRLEPTMAVFIGYFFTWFALVEYSDFVLASLLVRVPDTNPALVSKIGGAILGFSKGTAAFVFAAMVAFAHNHVPEPTHVSMPNRWLVMLAQDSFLLPRIHVVAARLNHPLGKFVLSDSSPRVRPEFFANADPFASIEKSEERKGFEFARSWKRFQRDMDNLQF